MTGSENYYELSRQDILFAVLLCFVPASLFSVVSWFSGDINWSFSNVSPSNSCKFFFLIAVLALVHMTMLILFRKLIQQISGQFYVYSALSGVAVAPAMSLLSISPFSIQYYEFGEEAGVILLLCAVTGWAVTVLPYLPGAFWHDFQSSLNGRKRTEGEPAASLKDGLFPAYVNHEFRFEYTYGTKYRLRNLSLIEVQHKQEHIGYLDPRSYEIYGYQAGDLAECRWRVILKKSDGFWIEVSSRMSQAEASDPGEFTPSRLESRVSDAVKRVLEIEDDHFSFHEGEGELPGIKEKISCYDKNIKQLAPLYPVLEEMVGPAVKGSSKQQIPLCVQMELSGVPDATHIIDVVDTSDYSHYYIAVRPEQRHEDVIRDIETKTRHLVHKVWEV